MPMVAAGEDHRAAPALRLVGTLALLGVIGVAIAGPALILIGFGAAFRAALVPFFILLPGIWMLAYGNICSFVLSRQEAARARPRCWRAPPRSSRVVLDLALIPPFGAGRRAIASTAAYTLFGVTSLVLVGADPRDAAAAAAVRHARRGARLLEDGRDAARDRPPRVALEDHRPARGRERVGADRVGEQLAERRGHRGGVVRRRPAMPPPVSASMSAMPGMAEPTTARPAARYSASFIGRPIASEALPGERQTRAAAT